MATDYIGKIREIRIPTIICHAGLEYQNAAGRVNIVYIV